MLVIILLLTLTHMSTPGVEVVLLFVLSITWLALGAWTADRRDFLSDKSDCGSWGNHTIPTKNETKTISSFLYCNEMRVIEAFSWVLFGVFAIFFVVVINLTTIAIQRGGRPFAWSEPMLELPWYGEWPGYSGGPNSLYPTMHMAEGGMFPGGYYPGGVMGPHPMGGPIGAVPMMQNGGLVVQQLPGHSTIIRPGVGGMPATVEHHPGHVTAV